MPSSDTSGSPEKPQSNTGPADKRQPRDRRKGTLKRSLARLAAIQALYQMEMSGATAGEVVDEFLRHRLNDEVDGLDLSEADRTLLADLVRGTTAERDRLDDMLAAVLNDDWPIDRLERLLRILLRTAVYELSERLDTPVKVVITEYMNLAHSFFSEKEPSLVNGVLDRIARSLRPEELEEDGGSAS
jgi:N utilization substance protein B